MAKLIEERKIVVPGEGIYQGMDYSPGSGTYREQLEDEDQATIRSSYLGAVEYRKDSLVKTVPLRKKYIPQTGDSVIGEISRISYSNWTVELNSPYKGILPVSEAVDEYVDLGETDISKYLSLGDLVVAKVTKVTKEKDVQLSMSDKLSKKLERGTLTKVPTTKVPRLIGKKGSMINTIKKKTDCTIVVGQNGRVWIKGEAEGLARAAVQKVNQEAHTEGLTERISDWLDEKRS